MNQLQRSTVNEGAYDIAFTKEYFDEVRREAGDLGDVLMRTLIVLNGRDWSFERVTAVNQLRNVRMMKFIYMFPNISDSLLN